MNRHGLGGALPPREMVSEQPAPLRTRESIAQDTQAWMAKGNQPRQVQSEQLRGRRVEGASPNSIARAWEKAPPVTGTVCRQDPAIRAAKARK